MDFIITSASAATATFFLVAMVKLYFPTSPAWLIGTVVFIGGQAFTFLAVVGQGQALTKQTTAVAIFAGVSASATAAGIRSVDNKADSEREKVQ